MGKTVTARNPARPGVRAAVPAVTVVALVADRACRARLVEALRGRATVAFCERPAEVLALLREARAAGLVIEPRDGEGVSTASAVHAVRAGFPSVPVVGYCSPSCEGSQDILALAQAGVHDLVLRGVNDEGIALRHALAGAGHACAATLILGEVLPMLPESARPIMEYCVRHADRAPTVEDVARALAVHRKTLRNRLSAAGLPAPSVLVGWGRLLMAAKLLEDPGRTAEQVALMLDYPSASAFRNTLRRYTKLRPTGVRERGGLTCVLSAFRCALAAGDEDRDAERGAAGGR